MDGKFVLGGTATYAALAARNLGQRVGLLTSAAFEPGLVDVLHGIQVARLPAEETTRFHNQYEGEARQQTVEARAELLRVEHLLPSWRPAPIVHLAPIADEVQPDAVNAFPDALLVVTPQGWLRDWGEDGVVRPTPWKAPDAILARADAVILSEEDVHAPEAIEELASKTRLLVVTRGQRGASVYQQGDYFDSPAFRVRRKVDPTGAGDVFAAAFVVHFKQTADARASADFANCVASFVVEKRHTAGIPDLDQIADRWRNGKRRKELGRG